MVGREVHPGTIQNNRRYFVKTHFNLITPIGRPENMPVVARSLMQAISDPRFDATYTWWWAQFNDESLGEKNQGILESNPNIRMVLGDRKEGFHDIMHIFNLTLDAIYEQGEPGFVWHIQDDNIVPPWAMAKWCEAIEQHPGKKVYICCQDRGDHAVLHGTSTLHARPEDMVSGRVSLEQYLIEFDTHRDYRYPNNACGDGVIMEHFHTKIPEEYVFLPGFYIPFNALEPGRYEAEHLSWFTEYTEQNPKPEGV